MDSTTRQLRPTQLVYANLAKYAVTLQDSRYTAQGEYHRARALLNYARHNGHPTLAPTALNPVAIVEATVRAMLATPELLAPGAAVLAAPGKWDPERRRLQVSVKRTVMTAEFPGSWGGTLPLYLGAVLNAHPSHGIGVHTRAPSLQMSIPVETATLDLLSRRGRPPAYTAARILESVLTWDL